MTVVFLILLLLLNPLHKYYKQSIQNWLLFLHKTSADPLYKRESNAIRNFQLERDQFETKLKDKI